MDDLDYGVRGLPKEHLLASRESSRARARTESEAAEGTRDRARSRSRSKNSKFDVLTPEEMAAKDRADKAVRAWLSDYSLWGVVRDYRRTLLQAAGLAYLLRRVKAKWYAYPASFLAWFLWAWRAQKPPNMSGGKGSPRHLPWFGVLLSTMSGIKSLAANSLKASRDSDFQSGQFSVPGNTIAFINDEYDRLYMLHTNWQNFRKNVRNPLGGDFDEMFGELLGRGIFTVDGDEWRDHRKIASHMFSANGLRHQMEHVFLDESELLCEVLHDLAKDGASFDLQNLMQCYTFDAICRIAFNVDPGALLEAFRTGKKPPFLVAFDDAQQIMAARGIEPQFVWRTRRWLNVGVERKLTDALTVINDYLDGIIADRRRSDAAHQKSNDLLSLYIDFADTHGLDYMKSDAYLKDVILNFMLAGRDTTSATLTHGLRLLSGGPELSGPDGKTARKLLEEEFARNVGTNKTWEGLKNAPYADAVFCEILRMYPPVPVDFRICDQDDVLPSGMQVRRGTKLGIPNYAIGRNPKYWKDPDRFVPDRWVTARDADGRATEARRRPDEFLFPVFWSGARLCLGKDMARFEVKLTLARILERFDFDVAPAPTIRMGGNPLTGGGVSTQEDMEWITTGAVCFLEGGVQATVTERGA